MLWYNLVSFSKKDFHHFNEILIFLSVVTQGHFEKLQFYFIIEMIPLTSHRCGYVSLECECKPNRFQYGKQKKENPNFPLSQQQHFCSVLYFKHNNNTMRKSFRYAELLFVLFSHIFIKEYNRFIFFPVRLFVSFHILYKNGYENCF